MAAGLGSVSSLLLVAVVVTTSLRTVAAVTATEMKTHLTTTFASYNTNVRPVLTDQSTAVAVTVDMHLVSINNFDNQNQKLETTAYLDISWNDQVLANSWHDTTVASILVPQADVWLPDLALQNGFESLAGLGSTFLYVKVLKAGQASWKPYKVFESSCEVDVTFFPFDETTCDLKFVVWSNTKSGVTATAGTVGISLAEYDESSEWKILSVTSTNVETTTTTGVTFSIKMKRKPLFYLLNIILPVIMLVMLNIFVFVLPANEGEKAGFAITIFLAFVAFLTIISQELPQNSEKVSIFSIYIALMTFSSTFVVGATLVQLRLANRSDKLPIPACLLGVIRCVRSCCGGRSVKTWGADENSSEKDQFDEISWMDASNAIDFLLFWILLTFTILATVLCLTFAAVGADAGLSS